MSDAPARTRAQPGKDARMAQVARGDKMPRDEAENNVEIGKTNYQRVRDVIRSDIIDGQFQAGDRLKISELSARYGISAIPVREALHQLQGEGLIVLSANRGASVRRIDERFLWQTYEIRKAMEMYFVSVAASRARADQISSLRRILDLQKEAFDEADEELLQKLDHKFHTAIVEVTANDEALGLLSRTYNLTRPLRLRYGRTANHRKGMLVDHRAIVDAIAARDVARAQSLVSDHINRAFIDLANVMELKDDTIRRQLRAGVGAGQS